MNKTLLSVACSFILAGCVSQTLPTQNTPSKSSSDDSLALQVMNSFGYSYGLKDAEIPMPVGTNSQALNLAADAAILHEYLAGTITPVPGISNAAMSAFFVLDMFNDQSYLPRHSMWMPMWMPSNLAKNEQEAQLKMSAILEDAIGKALPAGYEVRPYEWTDKAIFGAESSNRVLHVNGPQCEEWSCVIDDGLTNLEYPDKASRTRMFKVQTPSFLAGSQQSYRPKNLMWVGVSKIKREYDEVGTVNGHWHHIETERLQGFDHQEFYKRLSSALPEWMFMYFGPESPYNEAGIPLILNRGNQLLFVKPKALD